MALDFPASPTNGQVYGSYTYNSTVGAWQSREDSRTVAVLSSTVPASANPGDIWINTNDGVSFVYYNDGTSAQWIEMLPSGVPLLSTKADLSGAIFTGNVTAPQFNGVLNGHVLNTNTGKTGNIAFITPQANSQATWANYPVGLGTMVNANSVANGTPTVDYQYFFKVANRDFGGGWGGLSINYTNGDMYTGLSNDNTTYATWRRLAMSADTHYIGTTAITLNRSSGSQTLTGVSIDGTAANVTGTVAVANGGTGATTLTSGGYLKGTGTSAITSQTGIPAGDITSGQIAAARMPTGSIVQVVQTNFITRSSQSYSNATVTDITGLSASITPKSTSSRIMIFARWFGELSPADATYNIVFGVKRNGTRVGEGTDNGSTVIRAITTSAISYDQQDVSSTPETMSFFYLDDPATTSAVTYQVFFIANVGAGSGVIAHNKTYNWTGQVNGFELGTSNITLMEVA